MLALVLSLALQDSARITMAQAVERALAQYPTVGAARAQQQRSAADTREASSALRPRLVLDATLTQYQEPFLVYPLHGFPSFPPVAGSASPAFDRTLIQGSAFATWTLFDFGQRRSRVQAARALASAADAALDAAQSAIVARTATAYLRVVSARALLAAHDERLAALTAEAARSRRLLEEGQAPRLLVLRADAALARARAEGSQAAAQRDVAEHALGRLMGIEGDAVHRASLPAGQSTDTTLAATAAGHRAELATEAARSSPDVLEARRRADAARAAAAAARSGRLPELRLQTGLIDRGASGHDFRAEWQAGLSINHALYTGGQRGAIIARADADALLADEQRRLAELHAAEAVDRAIAALVEARARSAALRAALEQTRAVAEVERTALEVGAGTQPDYLDALADVVREQSQLIEAVNAELAAMIELARVTGRLSADWVRRNVN